MFVSVSSLPLHRGKASLAQTITKPDVEETQRAYSCPVRISHTVRRCCRLILLALQSSG